MIVVFSSLADQGAPLDWAKSALIATRKCDLESLTAVNKGAAACVIQLFNLPFDPSAVGTVTVAGNVATLANHRLLDGDQVTLTGSGSGTASGYVRKLTADKFQLFDSRAHAQATGSLTGLVTLTFTGTITTVWTAGVIRLDDGTEAALVPEEYPILGAASSPSNQMSFTSAKFSRGLFVRAVTALNGSTLISSADVKFTPRYRLATGTGA